MKEKVQDPGTRRNEYILGFVIITFFSALSSAFIGGILGNIFGAAFQGLVGFVVTWWQGALLGFVVGIFYGAFRAVVEIRRSSQLEQRSSELGLKPMDDESVRQIESDLKVMFARDVDLIDASFLSVDGAHLVVGDVRLEQRQASRSSNSQVEPLQTCAVFQFDEFQFPSFDLRPEGMLNRIFEGLLMDQDIDFDDSPEFSDRYMLTGRNRVSVEQLFTQPVRAHFEGHSGLRVVAAQKQLVLFRPNELCSPDQLNDFVSLAMETVDRLQASAALIDESDAVVELPKPQSKKEAIEQLAVGGVVGALLRHQINTTMVDSEELDLFLSQTKPRKVPRELKKRFGYDPLVMTFSFFAMFIGMVFVLVSMFGEQIEGDEDGIVLRLAGLGIAFLGAMIWFASWYFRNRKMRVLKSGEVRQGTVTSVDETGWVLGNERVYQAKFKPEGEDRIIRAYMRGCNIEKAKQLAETGERTRLLFDSVKPDNSLLIECYSF